MEVESMTNLEKASSRKIFQSILVLLAFVLAGNISLLAQEEHKNPARGFQPGASYALSDIETINTTNGNLMFNIPLVSLPKGRGEVGRSISLTYNSKLYDTSVEELLDDSNDFTDQNMLVLSQRGGWNYSTNDYYL